MSHYVRLVVQPFIYLFFWACCKHTFLEGRSQATGELLTTLSELPHYSA